MGFHRAVGGVSRATALTALAGLAESWGVAKTKRHQLLGLPESTVNHWYSDLARAQTDDRALDGSVIERISHLVSIYDGLHRLLAGTAGDNWMRQGNRAFGGQKPLDMVLSGRFEDVIRVRHHVDQALYR